MPEIEGVYQKLKDRGIAVIAIDIMEDPKTVRDFVTKGGYSFDFAIDTTGQVAMSYRVDLIPASFFVKKTGIVTGTHVGGMKRAQIEAYLLDAMK